LLLGFVCFWLLGLGAARAEPSAPQSDADRAIEEARGAQSQGRLEEAIAGYERAYESSGDPALLFTLGELLRQVNRDAAAVKMFRAYLRHDPRGKHQRSAEKQIDELSAPAAHAPATPAPAPASAPVQPLPGAAQGASTSETAPGPVPSAPLTAPAERPPVTTALIEVPAHPAVAQPPMPAWVPWTLTAATLALGVEAALSGLSASNHYDDLKSSCAQTTGCTSAQVDDVKSRARRANIFWALTGVAAVGAGVTIYINAEAAGMGGLWRF
jgi:hypothetical protein